MTDQTPPSFKWRDIGTPLAELAPGEIAYCDPPPGEVGTYVNLRGHDGLGKGPLRFTDPNSGAIHLSSRRS